MKIVVGLPPMWADIRVAFNLTSASNIIFAWGDTIYNPGGRPLPSQLLAHEAVHAERQDGDVEGWWRRYIASPEFRLAEEIPAHRAEYRAFCEIALNRQQRRHYLRQCAGRLASALYGRLITVEAAKVAIAAA